MDSGLWLVSLFWLPQLMAKVEGRRVKERESGAGRRKEGEMKMGRERRLSTSFIENPFLLDKVNLFTRAEPLANHFSRLLHWR